MATVGVKWLTQLSYLLAYVLGLQSAIVIIAIRWEGEESGGDVVCWEHVGEGVVSVYRTSGRTGDATLGFPHWSLRHGNDSSTSCQQVPWGV